MGHGACLDQVVGVFVAMSLVVVLILGLQPLPLSLVGLLVLGSPSLLGGR